MAKINARELDPQRYSCIQTEQQELKKQYSSHITMARICPYCQNKLEILCKGNHGAVYVKCPHCGEQASIEQAALGSKKYLVWWVRCKLCGATTASHSSEQDAVKAWNRRTYGKS